MVVGILSVRDKRYHPNRRLIEAAQGLGHKAVLIHTRDCVSGIYGGAFRMLTDNGPGFDVLIPRIGATINDYALSVVRQFEACGVRTVNGSEGIRLARNKFTTLQALTENGIPVPDSHLVVNFKGFQKAVAALGGYPVVVKMPSNRQGEGVALLNSPATAAFVLHNLQDNTRGLLVQAYIPREGRRDIRAFVVGNRVIGAMTLRPGPADFRSNIHLTGQGTPVELQSEVAQLTVRAARTLGLDVAGTDLVVDGSGAPKVLEVNYSPGFRGLERATGIDVATHIMKHATRKGSG
ncbi:MAG: RimK family alpha-L-glutamate ligase [Deltaproteobacteria bacterium]|nr:RimK family alpha-L-glutamate ligase [Deltaproteobacteria bacterium]